MERIYHHFEKWEDYKHGFYDNVSGERKKTLINKCLELFSDSHLCENFMMKVLNWKYSCEHNLSNESMNRIAYIGQAACCIYAGIPNSVTMECWSDIPLEIRKRADQQAQNVLNKWIYEQNLHRQERS